MSAPGTPSPSSAANPWARHYQSEWQSRSGDARLPYWLRVTALAYGNHQDNGHARFKRGEVALILGIPDGYGGIVPLDNVGRAIADAVTYGWLAEESFWGCLVVPAHAIKKGPIAHSPACAIHIRRARRRARTPHSVKASRAEPLTQRRLRSVNPSFFFLLHICSRPTRSS